jgi:PAS domain S-box-containing protein
MNTDRPGELADRDARISALPTSLGRGPSFIVSSVERLWYQGLFEFAPDSQLVTDLHGVILEANYAAAALFQFSKEFLIGKPLGLLLADGYRSRLYDSLAMLTRSGGADEFESRLTRSDGLRHVAIRTAFVGESTAGPAVLRWLLQDITARRRDEIMRVELLRRLVRSQENERRRISREMHDYLGQELTGLTLGLKALEPDLAPGTDGRRRLRELQEAVDRIGHAVHEMAVDLRPTALDDLGLRAALQILVQRWSKSSGVAADFHFVANGTDRFPADVESAVYRIIQEALTNVAKHADATHVSVIVEHRDGKLIALVEDDGQGFEPDRDGQFNRLGLRGMDERVMLVGGTLQIESARDVGATVRILIPCT